MVWWDPLGLVEDTIGALGDAFSGVMGGLGSGIKSAFTGLGGGLNQSLQGLMVPMMVMGGTMVVALTLKKR